MGENFIKNLSSNINRELAVELSQFTGDWITLNKDVEIDQDALAILSNYKGRIFTNSETYVWEDFELQNKVRKSSKSCTITDQLKSVGIKGLVLDFYGHYEWKFNGYALYEKLDLKIDIESIINDITAATFPGPDKLAADKYAESYVTIKINTEQEYGKIYHSYSYEFQDDKLYYCLIIDYLHEAKTENIELLINELDVSTGYEIQCIKKEATSLTYKINTNLISSWLNYAIHQPISDPISETELDFQPSYSVVSQKIKNITRYESTSLNICIATKSFTFSNSKGSVTVSINEPLKEAAKIYL